MVEAVASAGGRDVARASAWRVLRTGSERCWPRLTCRRGCRDAVGPPPDGWMDGYLSAIEWRPVRGHFAEPGPATVWARLRYPLVPDEEPGPLERVLAVADSGNGLSGELDIGKWQFINPELTVHLHREAAGEWICLAARTAISSGGAGLATSMLSDQSGCGGPVAADQPRACGPPTKPRLRTYLVGTSCAAQAYRPPAPLAASAAIPPSGGWPLPQIGECR